MLATYQLQRIIAYIYLVNVLQRIDQHPVRLVIELTLQEWKMLFAKDSRRSDLDRARNSQLHQATKVQNGSVCPVNFVRPTLRQLRD